MSTRRTIRLAARDYSAAGQYFVTMCTVNREPHLGRIVAERVVLSPDGQAVADTWRWLERQYSYVSLDEWCIMPDHLHGILVLGNSSAKTIGSLVGAFKTRSTAAVNRRKNTPGQQFWQRDFWDHVVRDHVDLDRIRLYIRHNISAGAWHPGAA